jgi:hypothetical protein
MSRCSMPDWFAISSSYTAKKEPRVETFGIIVTPLSSILLTDAPTGSGEHLDMSDGRQTGRRDLTPWTGGIRVARGLLFGVER